MKDQTTPSQNGIYICASGSWTRAGDMDSWAEVPGSFVFVEQGTTQADSGWVSTADQGGTLNTTPITWVQFSGAGQVIAGSGMTKTGNSLDVIGTAARILANADSIDIDPGYVGQTSITTLGTIATGVWAGTAIPVNKGGTGATITSTARTNLSGTSNPLPQKFSANVSTFSAGVEKVVTHSLGTTNIVPAFRIAATDVGIELAWRAVDADNIGVTADVAYAGIMVVVIG